MRRTLFNFLNSTSSLCSCFRSTVPVWGVNSFTHIYFTVVAHWQLHFCSAMYKGKVHLSLQHIIMIIYPVCKNDKRRHRVQRSDLPGAGHSEGGPLVLSSPPWAPGQETSCTASAGTELHFALHCPWCPWHSHERHVYFSKAEISHYLWSQWSWMNSMFIPLKAVEWIALLSSN